MNPSKLLFLPEIIHGVALNLCPPDLLHCVQVCRIWSNLFIPYLYESIDDRTYRWTEIVRGAYTGNARFIDREEDWYLRIFTNYGQYIKSLSVTFTITANAVAAAQTCTKLETLKIVDFIWDWYQPKMVDSIIWNPHGLTSDTELLKGYRRLQNISSRWHLILIQQNSKTLRELHLFRLMDMFRDRFTGKNSIEVCDLLKDCHSLTHLEIWDYSSVDFKTDVAQLVMHIPQLQYFADRSFSWNRSVLTASMPSLVSLYIVSSVTIANLAAILEKLPHLQELRCSWAYTTGNPTITFVQKQSRLQKLQIHAFTVKDDPCFAMNILPMLPDLVDISIQYFGPSIATLIPTYCRNLRSFRQPDTVTTISPKIDLPSGTLNIMGLLLENCPHLVEFDGIGFKIEVDYLLDHPWVCTKLEILRCQIVGVHRLSEEEEMDYIQGELFLKINKPLSIEEAAAIEKHKRLRAQQFKVYDRLAELSSLRVLDLGANYRIRNDKTYVQFGANSYIDYGGRIPNTLELTLASGLDRLSGLKNIEIFGFEGVDHRIDYGELRWISENWPKLKVMRGLHETNLPNMLPDDTCYLREYMQRLRPNVKHQKKRP